jgi:6-phosphofructokinase 1
METCRQIQSAADARGYPLSVIGVPKTVDNDIVLTDCCPGFGSAAKYLATSIREVGLDLDAMTTGSGRAFVLEVMGRNAGWLAAACALAAEDDDAAPHLILLPEVAFDEAAFLVRVKEVVERLGSCAIVVAEGARGQDGQVLSMQDRNQKGYIQLGGAGEVIAERIHACLGYKVHHALADYLQRSARHIASRTDTAQAFGVGKAAVRRAIAGGCGVVGIERLSDEPYLWRTTLQAFEQVANLERQLPPEFIASDGFGVTDAFRRWCRPLIAGEDWPPFRDGLPDYLRLQLPLVAARLAPYIP